MPTIEEIEAALDRMEKVVLHCATFLFKPNGSPEYSDRTSYQIIDDFKTIRAALQQAIEIKRGEKVEAEWFFRWVARGKAGYAGMSLEQCVNMIWHHPDNPYSKNNPWAAQEAADE